MRKINWFRAVPTALALTVTGLLLLAVGALFFKTDWAHMLENLSSAEMLFALKLSIWTGLVSAALVMIVAIPVGYALSRFDFPCKGFVKAMVDLPIAFPEIILGLCLMLLFGSTSIGKALKSIGIEVVFTQAGVVMAQFFTALPYAIRIMKAAFDSVGTRLEFVSRSLGYNSFETFVNVSLPLVRNGLVAAGIISFARCFGTFGTVLILAGGTYMHTETLPIALYLNMSYGNMGMAMTNGLVLITVSFIAIFIFEKSDVGQ